MSKCFGNESKCEGPQLILYCVYYSTTDEEYTTTIANALNTLYSILIHQLPVYRIVPNKTVSSLYEWSREKAHLNTFPPALREKLKYDYIGTLCEGDGEQRTKEVVHSQLKH